MIDETEAACTCAAQQAAVDIPYVHVGEVRPFQYHFHSKRWYIEVDVHHHDPEQGSAMALYRVWKRTDGQMAAMKVDIRAGESEPEREEEPDTVLDWRALEAAAQADLEALQTDEQAVTFIEKYFSRELRPNYLRIYRSDRHEMGRSPRQAIDTLLSLPPLL